MPYKTILVHLNNEHRVGRLISTAVQLSLPSNAHLIGLFVVPHVADHPYDLSEADLHSIPRIGIDDGSHLRP